jgi:TolB-like protein/class 3 adenylate cyclase
VLVPQPGERRLAAVVLADVVGYSRMMAADDEGTLAHQKDHQRNFIEPEVAKYRGEIVNTPGDSILAEFPSVVDAMRCSIEIQRGLEARDADLPEEKRIRLRIGITLGDIIFGDDGIYGNGVNVAARLQTLADPGGICVSGVVLDQVRGKVDIGFRDMGERMVKNIPDPVRVYGALLDPGAAGEVKPAKTDRDRKVRGIQAAAVLLLALAALVTAGIFFTRDEADRVEAPGGEAAAPVAEEKPSIAVLPFESVHGGRERDYLGDGIAEDIVTSLVRIPKIDVIASSSSFTFRGREISAQQAGRELGVRYILEGGLRHSPDGVRITVRLVDTASGQQIWAERYDRKREESFALQDEITMAILTALQVELTEGEQARLHGRGTESLDAFLKLWEGRDLVNRHTREGTLQARRIFEEAVALDGDYALAWESLALTHMLDIFDERSGPRGEAVARAVEMTHRAVSLDGSLGTAHGLLGWLLTLQGNFEEGLAAAERGVMLSPGSADAHLWQGIVLYYAGEIDESLSSLEKGFRLNPLPSSFYYLFRGRALTAAGRHEEAREDCRRVVRDNPDDLAGRACLVVAGLRAGRRDEARTEAGGILRIDPSFSVEGFVAPFPYRNKSQRELLSESLRAAGLP